MAEEKHHPQNPSSPYSQPSEMPSSERDVHNEALHENPQATNPSAKPTTDSNPKQDRVQQEENPLPHKGVLQSQQMDDFIEYAKANTREMVAYILLVLGLLLLFISPFFGQALVGIVATVYFGELLITLLTDFNQLFEKIGTPRTIILAGLLFAFFINAPIIFLAAGLTIALKHLIVGNDAK